MAAIFCIVGQHPWIMLQAGVWVVWWFWQEVLREDVMSGNKQSGDQQSGQSSEQSSSGPPPASAGEIVLTSSCMHLSCHYSLRPLACTCHATTGVLDVPFAVPDRAMCFPLTAPGFSSRVLPVKASPGQYKLMLIHATFSKA